MSPPNLEVGRYAVFIWPAYAITALTLVALVVDRPMARRPLAQGRRGGPALQPRAALRPSLRGQAFRRPHNANPCPNSRPPHL